MAKDLLIDATYGRRTETVPWVPYAGVNCAYLIGEKADRYFKDAALMAKGVTTAAETYKADGIPLTFDLSMEAESVGCELTYWDDNVPSVTNHPCEKQTPQELGLKLPEKDSGRWPIIFEAARLAKPKLAELDCAMMGLLCGPLTLASHLAGPRIFTALIKKQDFAHPVVEVAGRIAAQAARFYVEMGCDIIALVDPVASQIRPATFKEFVTPNCLETVEVIRAAGIPSSFFICGDCTKVLEEVCRIGTDAFAVDEQLNMNFVRETALRYKKGFGGNLKLTLALSMGMISSREDALISLAAGGNVGFTLAPGCDLPYETPAKNLLEAVEARDFYNEYYPKYPAKV